MCTFCIEHTCQTSLQTNRRRELHRSSAWPYFKMQRFYNNVCPHKETHWPPFWKIPQCSVLITANRSKHSHSSHGRPSIAVFTLVGMNEPNQVQPAVPKSLKTATAAWQHVQFSSRLTSSLFYVWRPVSWSRGFNPEQEEWKGRRRCWEGGGVEACNGLKHHASLRSDGLGWLPSQRFTGLWRSRFVLLQIWIHLPTGSRLRGIAPLKLVRVRGFTTKPFRLQKQDGKLRGDHSACKFIYILFIVQPVGVTLGTKGSSNRWHVRGYVSLW